MKIRQFINDSIKSVGISKVLIQRTVNKVSIFLHAARPGMLIGKKGNTIDKLKQQLEKKIGSELSINIVEVKKPEANAVLIADSIARPN